MSIIVRAMATAVSGSLDGVLMIMSLRVMQLRSTEMAAIVGTLPAMTCTARAPKARTWIA